MKTQAKAVLSDWPLAHLRVAAASTFISHPTCTHDSRRTHTHTQYRGTWVQVFFVEHRWALW
jgi:hypothetical protein